MRQQAKCLKYGAEERSRTSDPRITNATTRFGIAYIHRRFLDVEVGRVPFFVGRLSANMA